MRETKLGMRVWSLLACMTTAAFAQSAPPRIEIVSALGNDVESSVLEAVVEARQAYAELGFALRKPHLPVRIVLLPTVVELAPYLGAGARRSRAFSFAGDDHNSIVMAWAAPGNAERATAHEYAHLVDPLEDAPAWFREGLAEYLSYFEPAPSGRLRPAAPARHLVRLRDSPWLSADKLLSAARGSAAFQAPTFYAQSWLLVHWLASRGVAPARLRPLDLDAARKELGPSGLDAALRAHFDGLDVTLWETGAAPAALAEENGDESWRVRLALSDIDRELGRFERAAEMLGRLDQERPGEPSIAAVRGALAMDRGRFDEAETLLDAAAAGPAPTARTRYRLALMLLRPAGERTRERARLAAEQIMLALEGYPDALEYRLTLAQALMVDQQWDASARELNRLTRYPLWRERAEREMEELERRRQQALAALPKPRLAPAPRPPIEQTRPLEIAEVPKPPKPAPPPPLRWPPPGATILAGRIDYVDCSGAEKIIVLRHPLRTPRIRERKGKPAKLFHSPMKDWTEIPCNAKGWTVNIAYYPYHNDDGILGTAVAILF